MLALVEMLVAAAGHLWLPGLPAVFEQAAAPPDAMCGRPPHLHVTSFHDHSICKTTTTFASYVANGICFESLGNLAMCVRAWMS